MTDEELIARWDDYVESMGSVMGEVEHMAQQMRNRIEALLKERDQWIEHTKNAVWADSEELELANDRIKGLEAAGRAYREATRHLKPCPETSAAFDAALKGEKP